MDIRQDEITTLHELCVNNDKLMKSVKDASVERPVSLILPMLYREVKSEALSNIIKGLNKCDYLNEVVIPLAAKNEKQFIEVKRFFKNLKIPKLIMWCNGPNVENLLEGLKSEGINLLRYPGKGRDVFRQRQYGSHQRKRFRGPGRTGKRIAPLPQKISTGTVYCTGIRQQILIRKRGKHPKGHRKKRSQKNRKQQS